MHRGSVRNALVLKWRHIVSRYSEACCASAVRGAGYKYLTDRMDAAYSFTAYLLT